MYKLLKRTLDLTVALILMVALFPIFVVVFVITAATMGWPPIFKQERAGRLGKPFTIYKFRSMNNKTDQFGNLLPDEERLTQFGKFIRATSLDEIPQIINVVRGDMSFVGPRPLYMRYITRYSDRQRTRLEVAPGITGWAQVNGRNSVDWQTKLELDAWYVEHCSAMLDLKILFMTVKKILLRDGITQQDRATVDEFMGNP